MKVSKLTVAVLLVSLAAAAPAALAQPGHVNRACCRAPAGAVVEIELVDAVSTKVQRTGDRFALRLAAPLVVGDQVVLRAGTRGVGEVIESTRPGMGGKPAKLVLAARYLNHHGGRIPLQGLQLSAAGRNNTNAAQAAGLGGIAFFPLGFIGLAVRGGDATFPAGTSATAKLAASVALAALGPAPREAASRSLPQTGAAASAEGSIEIPPPPAGEGQVVFFRRKSLLGTGQWFNVREDGKAIAKLTNGAYFVQVTRPGPHTYTATFEPELKDHLKLEIDPGETYFVEGALTKGLVVGAADLSPSDRAAFDDASKDLRPAAAPAADETAAPPETTTSPSDGPPGQTNAATSSGSGRSATP